MFIFFVFENTENRLFLAAIVFEEPKFGPVVSFCRFSKRYLGFFIFWQFLANKMRKNGRND